MDRHYASAIDDEVDDIFPHLITQLERRQGPQGKPVREFCENMSLLLNKYRKLVHSLPRDDVQCREIQERYAAFEESVFKTCEETARLAGAVKAAWSQMTLLKSRF